MSQSFPSNSPSADRLSRMPRWLMLGLRLGVCLLVMAWILHCIFMFEAIRITPESTWATLPRGDRWNVAWTQGPRQLVATLAAVQPSAMAISLLAMGGILLAGVARWRLVLQVQGLRLSWRRAIEITFVAHFFNSFLLGSTGGDVMRAIYAARETRHQKTEAVIAVFMDRIMGLWSLLLFGCVFMIPNFALIRSHELLKVCCVTVIAMTVAATLILLLALRGGLSSRWPWLRVWLTRLPKAAVIERSLRACRRFGKEPGVLLKVLAISMGLNVLCVLQVQVIADGLTGFSLDRKLTALLIPVITALIALPITPNGIGMREYLFVKILYGGPLTMDPNSAISLSLLAYGGSLVWSLVGGVVYLTVRRKQRLDDLDKEWTEASGVGDLR